MRLTIGGGLGKAIAVIGARRATLDLPQPPARSTPIGSETGRARANGKPVRDGIHQSQPRKSLWWLTWAQLLFCQGGRQTALVPRAFASAMFLVSILKLLKNSHVCKITSTWKYNNGRIGRHLAIFRRWTNTNPSIKINQKDEDFLTVRDDKTEGRHYFHTVIEKIQIKKTHT